MFKKYKGVVVGVVSTGLLSAGSAYAALPTDVTDAIAAAKADGLVVAGGFLAAIIVISAMLLAARGARG